MPIKKNVFWEDLAKDLEDPEQLRLFLLESIRIATIDSLVRQLDEARSEGGLSKAEIARKLGSEPANIRRFFTSGSGNPTLSTITEVAAALGMRVSLEPFPTKERQAMAKALSLITEEPAKPSAKRRMRGQPA